MAITTTTKDGSSYEQMHSFQHLSVWVDGQVAGSVLGKGFPQPKVLAELDKSDPSSTPTPPSLTLSYIKTMTWT